MSLLLAPGTRTLSLGEDTGFSLSLDADVWPNPAGAPYVYGSVMSGIALDFSQSGQTPVPLGDYKILAQGSGKPSVGVFIVREITPDMASYPPPVGFTATVGVANGHLNAAAGLQLAPDNYDIVAAGT